MTPDTDALIAAAERLYAEEHESDNPLATDPEFDRCSVDGDRVTLRDEDGQVLGVYEFGPAGRGESDHRFTAASGGPPFYMRAVRES